MGGSNFDLIAHELLRHQEIMKEMEAENRWLRQKVAELRAGRGIVLVIEGRSIPIHIVADSTPQIAHTPAQPASWQPVAHNTRSIVTERPSTQQPHTTIPLPPEEVQKAKQTTFLEEVMLDEFTTATGASRAIWQDPATTKETPKKSERVEEDEMAALRRELMGSFLLE